MLAALWGYTLAQLQFELNANGMLKCTQRYSEVWNLNQVFHLIPMFLESEFILSVRTFSLHTTGGSLIVVLKEKDSSYMEHECLYKMLRHYIK